MSTIPDSFCCPITLELMNDPVCDKEGNTFEKSAILDWITSHGCSPITRTPMVAADLIPNRALKDMIVEHFKDQIRPEPVTSSNLTKVETDRLQLRTFVDDSKMLITIDPGDSKVRTFLNVSCVIDISGSMESEATFTGENNTRESFGLTILDIVKHAVTTVLKSLNSNDRLAIIAFSDTAKIVLPLTAMDENGQTMAMNVLKYLRPYASTNLWVGLETGLNVLNAIDDKDEYNRISAVMLFTDGEPNIIPPRGHLPMLQMYRDRLGGLPGSINTFGFGYSLDSELLHTLAREGQGSYAFIPDSSFVGTVFVHAIANLKVTVAKSCRLIIEPLNGATFVNATSDLGEYLTAEDTYGITVDIGSIQTGQTKDILLQMYNLPQVGMAYASIHLNAETRTNSSYKLSMECDAHRSNDDRILPTYYRFKFIEVVKLVMKLMTTGGDDSVMEANELIRNLMNNIENSCPDEHSLALLQDIKGQVSEAIQPNHFLKWGRHYLPSLIYAHLYQVCNNFKDNGPQVYGGSLFKVMRDEADTLFCNLPPPKPSAKTNALSGGMAYVAPRVSRQFNMRMFNNSRNVCFHAAGMVRMFDGAKKMIQSITKGDRIQTINGTSATVVCVVKTEIAEKMIGLVACRSNESSNALLITPWHPIRLSQSERWIFPISIGEPKIVPCESVFNFVLDEHHCINVDDIDCVTLGHSLEDSVCAHEYFGSTRVIDDLRAMSGYSKGLVKLVGVVRDPITSKVNGLIEG